MTFLGYHKYLPVFQEMSESEEENNLLSIYNQMCKLEGHFLSENKILPLVRGVKRIAGDKKGKEGK